MMRRSFAAAAAMKKPAMNVLRLDHLNVPIMRQLQIEEALYRADDRNWCVVNRGAAPATVVLGISGKPETLVHTAHAKRDGVPLLKRFSGGGTVLVGEGTVFVTFVCAGGAVPELPRLFPRELMAWTGLFYAPVVDGLLREGGGASAGAGPAFELLDNDYVLRVGNNDDAAGGALKIGGNAQSIGRDRWLHHTSWLWSFDRSAMARYLHMPPAEKRPAYRRDRAHDAFLCPMCEYVTPEASPRAFGDAVVARLGEWFTVQGATLEEAEGVRTREHRKSNVFL